MFTQFQTRYPKGSLITELSAIDHGKYIVRCLVQVEGTPLVTALAAADTVEVAEDRARSRALAVLGIDPTTVTKEQETPGASSKEPVSFGSTPTTFSAPLGERGAPSRPTSLPLSADTIHNPIAQPNGDATSARSESQGYQPVEPFPEPTPTSNASNFSFPEHKIDKIVTDSDLTTPTSADDIALPNGFSSSEVEPLQDVETPIWTVEQTSQAPLEDAPAKSTSKSNSRSKKADTKAEPPAPSSETTIDFSDIIARTNVELKRLGWTNQQGRDYLLQTYGKRSRQLLTDAELLDFLHHLESELTPED
jgi:hypothetical protein